MLVKKKLRRLSTVGSTYSNKRNWTRGHREGGLFSCIVILAFMRKEPPWSLQMLELRGAAESSRIYPSVNSSQRSSVPFDNYCPREGRMINLIGRRGRSNLYRIAGP